MTNGVQIKNRDFLMGYVYVKKPGISKVGPESVLPKSFEEKAISPRLLWNPET